MLEWNGGHWKLNMIVCFGHLQNSLRDFQKNIDSVKSTYHSHDIQSPIENNYITVNFDDVIR